MNKKVATIIIFIILGFAGYFLISNNSKETDGATTTSALTKLNTNTNSSAPQTVAPADKIEVVHFHGTLQCWACITVGEYALKTIEEKFPNEYASGIITFKDINGELAENRDIVIKYQARGSSLFVNAIHGDKDTISEDTTVWRLVTNEKQFNNYFEKKLKNLLGN
jgi:hypothetical protein